MTRLLVSVRNVLEAVAALRGGADVIDVKEPRNGSLGAASQPCIAKVMARVAKLAPVSAALGELLDFNPSHDFNLPPGLRYVKLGLAGCSAEPEWRKRWRMAAQSLNSGATLIAVIYADSASGAPRPDQILDEAVQIGCPGVLVDTFDKRSGDLFRHWSVDRLARQLHDAKRAGMFTAVAGSLNRETIRQVLPLEPDLVAIRGAACRGERTGKVDAFLVHQLSQLVQGISLK